jgi:hypothetical protein
VEFQVTQYDAIIHLAAAHYGERHKGIAAGAYAGEFNGVSFWGYGGVKNTETLYFMGIVHAVNEVLAQVTRDDYRVTVFALSAGFKDYMTKYVPTWIANGGKNKAGRTPDGYDAAKECYLLSQTGHVDIVRVTPRRFNMEGVKAQANRIAQIAFERGATREIGNFRSGNAFNEAA